ncbi:MAG: hypothetical protein GQ532_10340 [Methylomarinum sp.]|nr:hypothetical protein [Methylomarinum sp.]
MKDLTPCVLKQGTPLVFRQRSNVKSDFRLGQRMETKDHMINFLKPQKAPVWMTDKAYSELPENILIREFSVNGVVYVTTLNNAKNTQKQH